MASFIRSVVNLNLGRGDRIFVGLYIIVPEAVLENLKPMLKYRRNSVFSGA